MKENPTPRDRDWYLRLAENPNAAREYMADILARAEARRQERMARQQRGLLRRLLPW